MPQYIAFMRAINVTGRFIKMQALAEHYRALGCTEVSTFINSGNLIFHAATPEVDELESTLQIELAARLGFVSEVFIRRPHEVSAAVSRAKTLASEATGALEVNVAWLKTPLSEAQVQALQRQNSAVDRLFHEGREIYWLCQVKQSESRLSNAVLERKLGLKTTIRRLSMLQQLNAQFLVPNGCLYA